MGKSLTLTSKAETLASDIESDTKSEKRIIDLSGVAVFAHRNGPAVYLADLLKAGYDIEPERLVRSMKSRLSKRSALLSDLESVLAEHLLED